ncbi:MAG: [FeFe] hydrogenase H-cluster radical SAM maturase HydE [Defluviitaleaceae bacterium]|nr:[FeFe] hydrogenase H-cluster radical SAM maturase HydE [Defluviitaleaceae bacterium]
MVKEILAKPEYSREDLLYFMKLTDNQQLQLLYDAAHEMKKTHVGKKAYYRGLIEFSNICTKDCFYCGIRKSSPQERYSMSRDEILEMALWAHENKYGSVTIQSGERQDAEFTGFVADLISEIKAKTNGELAMTLCLGEQPREVYEDWFNRGAQRYLLRMETSNKTLYQSLHPPTANHSYETRVECLKTLKNVGFQVGTGVMIGLPGQTPEDLVDDIIFYKKHDIDMIGMGPYIVHKDTPMGQQVIATGQDTPDARAQRFTYGLKMIALTRLYLKDVNIAATTALQALHPMGRELGLKAGANILMPIITLREYRRKYQLYDDKPCIDDDPSHCKNCLTGRVESIGDTVGFGEWGDPPHFILRRGV